MKIRFLRGYRGKLTREIYYEAGDVVSLPRGLDIVREGAAEPVGADTPTDAEKRLPKSRVSINKQKNARGGRKKAK